MDLGTILVVIGLVLAVVAVAVARTHTLNSHRLLAAAIICVSLGVLLGEGGLTVR